MGRTIDMCYGTIINGKPCPHEIKTGTNAGNCGKPFNIKCPDQEDQEEDTNE